MVVVARIRRKGVSSVGMIAAAAVMAAIAAQERVHRGKIVFLGFHQARENRVRCLVTVERDRSNVGGGR